MAPQRTAPGRTGCAGGGRADDVEDAAGRYGHIQRRPVEDTEVGNVHRWRRYRAGAVRTLQAVAAAVT